MKRSLFLAGATIFLIGCANTLCAQSDQPSLADIARQKSAHKAKRVVTNEEIPPSPEAANPASPKPAEPGAAKSDASADNHQSSPKSAPPADRETQLRQLMAENDNLQKVINKLQEKIEASEDRALVATLGEVVQHAKSEMAANQAKIDKLKSGGTLPSPGTPQPAQTGTPQPSSK